MKIEEINCILLSSKYGEGLVLGQTNEFKTVVWIQVKAGNVYGYSEVYSGIYTPDLVVSIVHELRRHFILLEIDNAISKNVKIPFISRNGVVNSVLGCLRWAFLDLKGKIEGKPVWSILTQEPNVDYSSYFSGGSAIYSANQIQTEIEASYNHIFSAYKMRIGYQDFETDMTRVRKARETLPSNALLLTDAIMGTISPSWGYYDYLRYLPGLVDNGVYWLEEPFHPDSLQNYEAIGERELKIAFGEALVGPLELTLYSRLASIDIFQFDATHNGDISDLANYSFKDDVVFATHTWGSALAFMMNLHLASTDSRFKWIEVPGVVFRLTESLSGGLKLEEIYMDRDNFLQRPGLGLDIDIEQLLRDYPYKPGSFFELKRS